MHSGISAYSYYILVHLYAIVYSGIFVHSYFVIFIDIISVYAVVHMDIFPNSLKYYLYSISHSNMPICRLYPFTLGVGKWLYYMQFIVLIHCPILRTGILQLYKLGYF